MKLTGLIALDPNLRLGDLQRIAKALKNPKSKPHQYCVRSFGFCTLCGCVTEYSGDFGLEGCFVRCLKCDATFGDGKALLLDQYILNIDRVPAYAWEKFGLMRSRAQQKKFFEECLKKALRQAMQDAREAHETVVALQNLADKDLLKKI